MPLVSFIVPIYNCEAYLRQCLDSIREQTIDDYEVILIDDGSGDSSGTICDEYVQRDYRFKVIHKMNEGLSAARNDGIELAVGDWITFVDSDDWVEPCFLEILASHQDVDYLIGSINYCKGFNVYESERFDVNEYEAIDDSVFSEANLKIAFFTAWSKFFKTKILSDNRLRFIPGVSPGEDTIFVFQYLNCIRSIYLSNVPCYNWRVANGLTNRKRTFEWIKYTINCTIEAIEQLEAKYHVDLSNIKFNSLQYLLDKIDVSRYSYSQLHDEMEQIATMPWMRELIADRVYVRKGKRRRIIDFLMRVNGFFIMSVLCKQLKRFY